MSKFPKELEDFAAHFITLQEKRHEADYDPHVRITKTDASSAISTAEAAIRKLNKTRIKDRRAFAAWTTMKHRSD